MNPTRHNYLFEIIYDETAKLPYIKSWREEIIKKDPYRKLKKEVERDEIRRMELHVHQPNNKRSTILQMLLMWFSGKRSQTTHENM